MRRHRVERGSDYARPAPAAAGTPPESTPNVSYSFILAPLVPARLPPARSLAFPVRTAPGRRADATTVRRARRDERANAAERPCERAERSVIPSEIRD